MAGEFDDLIPNGGSALQRQQGTLFDDLVPPPTPTPEQQRADRLRKIARTAMQQHDGEPGAGSLFADSVTLGLQKPVGGVAAALGGELGEYFGGEPATFGERYRAQTGAYQDRLDEAGENSGWAGTGANVAGSLLTGGPARGVVQQGFWPMVKSAFGFGAVEGAARNSEDLDSAIGGAAKGGVTAGLTSTALGGAVETLKRASTSARSTRRAERLANRGPEPEQLRQQARVLYGQLDDAGVAYSNQQSVTLVDDLLQDLRQNGYDPQGVHSVMNGVVGRLEELRGQPVSLETLQHIREQVGSNAGAIEPQVRRIAGRVLNSIDGFVANEMPALSQVPGDQIAPMWNEARRLWRTAAAADDIGWRLDKAQRRTDSTNSGTNVDNPIRQNIRSVIDKSTQPGRRNPYNAQEMAQMERVVSGGTLQNRLRSFGNTFGGSGPVALAGPGIGGSALAIGQQTLMGGEPSMLGASALLAGGALWGAGRQARTIADRMSQNEADALVRLIATGTMDQGRRAVTQGPPTRANLALLLAEKAGVLGASRLAAGEATR